MADFMLVLTLLSTVSSIVLAFVILHLKKKSQMQNIFLCAIVLSIIWNAGTLMEMITNKLYNSSQMVYVNISYLGICFLPVFLLLFGIAYANTEIKFSFKYYSLFVVPVVSTIIIWTNDLHKMFFLNYSTKSYEASYGIYYYFHSAYSYICILIGISFLAYFSMKNSGLFSRQTLLILIGISIPLLVNIIYSFNLAKLTFSINSVVFTFSMICFAIAIFRYKFLSVVPIARKMVMALISDSYITIDEGLEIIDHNESFTKIFRSNLKLSRNCTLPELFKKEALPDFDIDRLIDLNKKAIENKATESAEVHFKKDNFDRFFKLEITPIYSKTIYVGTIVLFKDITESVKNLQTIKEKQAILLEQERLASLGQLIGGIAHNLKTPIMSISGGIEALKDLVVEYRDSIGDNSVTDQDHREIAQDMLSWLDRMKPYCSYMSDVISAVKGQAVQMSASGSEKFTVDELVKRVELLMKHELKKYHCLLKTESFIDMNTEIKGDVNNLVQVFDNIIVNAIQAYEGADGIIDFQITRSGDSVEFIFRDYAKGLPKSIINKLFKEMVTTKGKNGTGLGLYISYATIKGRFGGNMTFTSKEGCGTTFHISVPCITYGNQEVV